MTHRPAFAGLVLWPVNPSLAGFNLPILAEFSSIQDSAVLEQKHQAIQASVALALIWSVTLLISIAVLGFSLAGEWQRALNASSAGLIILPACFVLHRQLRRGKGRQVLLAITLLTWMVSTLLLFRAGTIVNPNTAVLVGLSITGSLAHDRLLARLIPCLSLLSISAVYLLGKRPPNSPCVS